MQFDLFHSLCRIDTVTPKLGDRQIFQNFLEQVQLAEAIGFATIWVAESHFSSEVQKTHKQPVIPYYQGEVGLNNDSLQLASWLFQATHRIGFGTAIFNIVGGNGGPISAADRIRALAWYNSLSDRPRRLDIGVAAGRFPYINRPYGIVPRNAEEHLLWSAYKRLIFAEALEIFLRLSNGETLCSDHLTRHTIGPEWYPWEGEWEAILRQHPSAGTAERFAYHPRWQFEPLKLIPELPREETRALLNFVLGSSDPYAREIGWRFDDMDLFTLSFMSPEYIDKLHTEMRAVNAKHQRPWHRHRLPRTVLVFMDTDPVKAHQKASRAFDVYIEAMRGTVGMPAKDVLMSRALIGDSQSIREQLSPDDPHGFHPDDRLMLWFEFNQPEHEAVCREMRQFAEEVMPHFVSQ